MKPSFANPGNLLSGIGLSLLLFATAEPTEPAVRYQLDFSEAANHYVLISAEFKSTGKDSLEVFMPVWTPGSYLIREYARNIETITAVNENGTYLPIQKSKKNRWIISTKSEANKIIVKYRLYCREMSVRTNWVEEGFAILNGAPTFLTTTEVLKSPHEVTLDTPENWSQVSTALNPVEGSKRSYLAPDFDYLVDSPILLGNQHVEKFEVAGIQHELVCLGGEGFWDYQKAVKDVAKIVTAHHEVWGVVPYKNYKFLNAIVESGGGLEHDNSTLMMTSRWSFGTRSRYTSWLSLVSHEFFHTWNIRRLRPKELVEYDYENENYFSTLWIGEGVTSYYDDLLVKRADLTTESEYLGQLSKQIRSLQTTAGRLTQSLSDSSKDAWIKYYRPDENSKNARISYYTKGAVAAFLLDAKIRKATDGEKSLDDLLRTLYEKHSGKIGFTSAQFRALANEISGEDLSEWFATAIDSTAELEYQEALDYFGLRFKARPKSDKPRPLWTGLSLSSSNGKVEVLGVTRNSPGFLAGINVGDELIAMDGLRITSSDLNSILKRYKKGDKKKLLITRRGRVVEKEIQLSPKSVDNWTISKVSKPTDEQKKRLNDWLKNKTSQPKKNESKKDSTKTEGVSKKSDTQK